MKNLKKIGALLLALAMVLGMATVAMAADPTNEVFEKDDANTETVKAAVTGDDIASVTFKVYYNENKDAVPHPATTFTYTLATGAAVADKGIEAGPMNDGATTPNALIGFDAVGTTTKDVAWTVNDTDVSKDVKIAFGTYTKSGIYRYTIKQVIAEDAKTIGVESEDGGSNADYTMNLDVYVDKNLKVIGVVLAKPDATLTKVEGTSPNPDIMQYAGKVDGFRNKLGDNTAPEKPDNPNDPDPDPTDDLIGYKLTITKTTEGNMADTEYQFPFYINTTGRTSTTGLKIKVIYTTNAVASKVTVPELTDGTNAAIGTALDGTVKIANGGSVTICGLPKTIAFEIAEKVDATEGYTVTIDKTDADFAAAPVIGDNTGRVDNKVDNTKITGTMKDAYPTIAYTNTRDAISPTGVVLRTAPYVLMLGATPLFILLGKKRKEEEDEE